MTDGFGDHVLVVVGVILVDSLYRMGKLAERHRSSKRRQQVHTSSS